MEKLAADSLQFAIALQSLRTVGRILFSFQNSKNRNKQKKADFMDRL
jgi:hypothetical protein